MKVFQHILAARVSQLAGAIENAALEVSDGSRPINPLDVDDIAGELLWGEHTSAWLTPLSGAEALEARDELVAEVASWAQQTPTDSEGLRAHEQRLIDFVLQRTGYADLPRS